MMDENDKDLLKRLTRPDYLDRVTRGFNITALSPREEREYTARLEEAFLARDTAAIDNLKDSGAPFTHRMLEAAFVHKDQSLTRLCLDRGVVPKDSFVKEIIETAETSTRHRPVLREIVMHGMISDSAVHLLKEKGMGELLEAARPKSEKEKDQERKAGKDSGHPRPGYISTSIKLN